MSDSFEELVYAYFLQSFDIILQEKHRKEAGKILKLNLEKIQKSKKKIDFSIISIPFKNGTMYYENDKSAGYFKEGFWDKEEENCFIVDYEMDMNKVKTKEFQDKYKSSLFLNMIKNMFVEDLEIEKVQIYLASVLIPRLNLQTALIIEGNGSNGKGVLTKSLKNLLGKCSSSVHHEDFNEKHLNIPLLDSIVNISTESTDMRLCSKHLKELISCEPIQINQKYKEVMDGIIPQAKIIITVNQALNVNIDYAIRRRLLIVKAKNYVSQAEKSDLFEKQILFEKEYFVHFLLQGIKLLFCEGGQSKLISKEEYFQDFAFSNNELCDFYDNYIEINSHKSVSVTTLYEEYKNIEIVNGNIKIMNVNQFSKKLNQLLTYNFVRFETKRVVEGSRKVTKIFGIDLKRGA